MVILEGMNTTEINALNPHLRCVESSIVITLYLTHLCHRIVPHLTSPANPATQDKYRIYEREFPLAVGLSLC